MINGLGQSCKGAWAAPGWKAGKDRAFRQHYAQRVQIQSCPCAGLSILGIAKHRVAQAGKLHPYLMGPPCEQTHLHKACPVIDTQGADKAESLFGIGGCGRYRAHALKAVHGFFA